MLDTTTATMHENHSRQLIAELQEERSQMWGLYCQMADMKALYSSSEIRPILSNFLQLLIDYVSLGHFGMYEQLTKSCPPNQLSYASHMYPKFSQTTASAISFSERYENGKRNFKTDNLAQDLSVLGENLAERMELEDRLCSILLH